MTAHAFARRLTLLGALVTSPCAAEPPIDISAYPELAPDALLPPILADFRRTLKDPHSITSFTLCPPDHIKFVDGKPVRWSVNLSFNARNSYGGYEGIHMFAAFFRGGHLSGPIASDQFDSNAGFAGLINGMIARKMANCPSIPDDKIRALIDGSMFKPG